jgi:hypothetical protein
MKERLKKKTREDEWQERYKRDESSGRKIKCKEGCLLTDKRRIPLRSASVRTPHLFHHGIPKVLVNPRSKGITSVLSTFTL